MTTNCIESAALLKELAMGAAASAQQVKGKFVYSKCNEMQKRCWKNTSDCGHWNMGIYYKCVKCHRTRCTKCHATFPLPFPSERSVLRHVVGVMESFAMGEEWKNECNVQTSSWARLLDWLSLELA